MMGTWREAIVLAGGFGTRLAHIVPNTCKPMAPVAGRPFLRYLMDQLSSEKFDRVVVADGYRREQIEGYFGQSYRGMGIAYSSEDSPLLTGGAIRKALQRCSSDWVFVLNGDTYLDVDFGAMEKVALSSKKSTRAIIAVKKMGDTGRYGTVKVSNDGTIAEFLEKRSGSEGLINAGVYLVRREALDSMPAVFSFERDYLEKNVSLGCFRALECRGGFIDIGVPEDYHRAQTLFLPLSHGWRLALFDRDGTINEDVGHLHSLDGLKLIPKTVELLRRYSSDSDFRVVVVSNQAGIAKGLYGEEDMRRLHHALDDVLNDLGCRIDAYYFCPHHPDYTGPCDCRKPAPGMLLAAMRDFDSLPEQCVMYGDSPCDRDAAAAAGVRFCHIDEAQGLSS